MRWIAALGGGAFVLVSLVVGFRLLRLAWTTRALPETCLGAGLFLMGGFAYPLTSVARQAEALSDETRTALMIIAHLLMVTGIMGFAVFTQRVFRPASPGARSVVALLAASLLGCLIWQAVDPGFRAGALAKEGLAIPTINVLLGLTNIWAALESRGFGLRLQRQVQLGLAEPAAPRPFHLWARGCGCAAFIALHTTVLHALSIDPAASVAGALVIGPFGMVAAFSVSRAFGPPPKRAEGSAEATSSG